MRHWKRELWILGGLVVLAVATLVGLYGQPPSRGFDLLNKIAFAVLVTVVVRSLYLALSALEDRPPDPLLSFERLGMCRAIHRLSDEELKSRLAEAQEIRVLKTWFPETRTIREGLEEALTKTRPAKVKLLLMHPDSEVLRARSESAGPSREYGPEMVIQALKKLVEWEPGGEGLEVGLYDGWPGCPTSTSSREPGPASTASASSAPGSWRRFSATRAWWLPSACTSRATGSPSPYPRSSATAA